MLKNKALLVLLIAVFIKGLIWIVLTPIFQVPDEPSHFAYVQFIAENKRLPQPRREVFTSVELMGVSEAVNFNWQIIHPVWQYYQADWLNKIISIDKISRNELVDNPELTSLKRPGLYYLLSAGIYWLFYWSNFLIRFFAVRAFSLVCHLLTVWLVILTAKKITKDLGMALAAGAMTGFLPGLSFISAGVDYEPLAALAAAAFFYLIVNKTKTIYLLLLSLTDLLIKPDLIFLFFLLPRAWMLLPLVIIGFYGLNSVVEQTIRGGYPLLNQWLYFFPLKDFSVVSQELIETVFSKQLPTLLFAYCREFMAVHGHQIFPWYWGVFGWLEKTMPLWVYTGLKAITGLSLIGLYKIKFKIGWLIKAVIFQAAVVIANDFIYFSQTGQLYGIQGRYFYPAVSAQMILLTLGLNRLIKARWLIIGAVILNLIGLFSLYQYFGWVWGN